MQQRIIRTRQCFEFLAINQCPYRKKAKRNWVEAEGATLLPDFVIKLERKPLDNLVITLTNTEVGGIGKPRLATRPEINMKLACNPDSLRPRIDARK